MTSPYRDPSEVPPEIRREIHPLEADLRPSNDRERMLMPYGMFFAFLVFFGVTLSFAAYGRTTLPLGFLAFVLAPLAATLVERRVLAPRALRRFNTGMVPILEQMARGKLDSAELGLRGMIREFRGRGGLQALALFNLAALRTKQGDPWGALSILLALQAYRPTRRASNIVHKVPMVIALHMAQIGEIDKAKKWLATARKARVTRMYTGNIEALIFTREGRYADAERCYQREWADLERQIAGAEMRTVQLRRAFALEQAGAPAADVSRWIEAARPVADGEHAHVGAGWDEMTLFLRKHDLLPRQPPSG